MISRTALFDHFYLKGTDYEAGQAQAEYLKKYPQFIKGILAARTPDNQLKKSVELFDQFCPGLNEEIQGFADTLGVKNNQLKFHQYTSLHPSCSQLLVIPSKTQDNHTYAATNYDFTERLADRRVCTTHIKGKHKHIGSSELFFGRNQGMNDHHLTITFSSAGMPVSAAIPYMRKPKVTGLQYWAVVRTLLEQCKTVDQALSLASEMPIAHNVNFIIADKKHAALYETYDGHHSSKNIENSFGATNHLLLPELQPLEPTAAMHSIVRYTAIQKLLQQPTITKQEIKELFSTRYPNGLCLHYFPWDFGTVYSLLFDITAKTAEICFGPPSVNSWHTFDLTQKDYQLFKVKIPLETTEKKIFAQQPIQAQL
ncbi:MAG: C45 family peptidase [Candidatus Woesearchaeota archaeon]